MKMIKSIFIKGIRKIFFIAIPELEEFCQLDLSENSTNLISNSLHESSISNKAKLIGPYHLSNAHVGDYSYISINSNISRTTIGKFCSIGPNLICGWGIHPTNGISTSPMFYSTMKQNGFSLTANNKIEERKPIIIGNDVFIGANVTILDGVTIGDGSVIGAGAVVSKDIPPYAIAVGCPIQIKSFRFTEEQIEKLLQIRWWEFENEQLENVEKFFFNIEEFINRFK